MSSVKVIDMTGPQVRVLSNYGEMKQQHTRPNAGLQETEENKRFLPVLLDNIDLLVEQTEQEILLCDKRSEVLGIGCTVLSCTEILLTYSSEFTCRQICMYA